MCTTRVSGLPPEVYGTLVEGAATGNWPDGDPVSVSDMNAPFERNGTAWQVGVGRRLDIPVLMGRRRPTACSTSVRGW